LTKICPNCKTSNIDDSEYCKECGTDLKGTTNAVKSSQTSTSDGISGFWNKQSKGRKAAIGIAGVCCIGLIIIIAISGMFSSDQTTANTSTPSTTNTPTTNTPTPTSVTISQLYNNAITNGTYVQVTGTVVQSDGTNLRIEDSNDQDIMVQGDNVNAYEGNNVTVVGTYTGPGTYDTAIGSSRTVPYVEDAKIV
jgi:hypothetical protein